MAENRSRTSIPGRRTGRLLLAFAAAAIMLALDAAPTPAQPGGGQATYQRKGTYAGDWQGHHGDRRHQQPMPQFSSQTSAGSFQRPYPYHLDYYRARWGGSYAPYFGNLYGPPNFFFGTPFYGSFNPFWGFGGLPFTGYGRGFEGSPGGGFDGGPFVGGAPYGPWQTQFGAGGAPYAAPFGGPMMGAPIVEGP